jgi:Protein of unknown function (DUF2934)
METPMSKRSQSAANAQSERSSPQTGNPRNSVGTPLPEEGIRHRAYEIYLERGDQPGSPLDDWLQAERELEQFARNQNRSSH